MSRPISPPPVKEWRPGALPAYLSNGVLGLRVGPIPQLDGVAILNGFAGVDGDSGAEAFARAPFPLSGEIEVDGVSLEHAPERAQLREQAYDFETGELRTRYVFDPDGVRAELEVVTFCSRTMPMLALQELVVTVDRACDVVLCAGVDHRGVPGTMVERHIRTQGSSHHPVDGSLRWESNGALASCGAAYVTELRGADAPGEPVHDKLRPLRTRYAFRARSGRRYRLRQITGLVCETMHSQPDLQAVRLVHAGSERGFDRLRKENAAAWREIWRGRIQLDAPTRWQALADAAHFYLQTSVHTSSPTSTYIFGLAYWPNYHYYRGHVMWDVETLVVPPLLLTNPDAARTLLEYRSERLPAARHNASMAGYRGAQFPWESGIRKGEESAPGEGAASAHEHHVSLDVAFAFSQFLHATHDWHWGREHAWHVLEDVAEWVESRGIETARGFEIHEVNGIAEREERVDNNAFVNMAAAVALREATILAHPLGRTHNPRWERLSREVFLPMNGDGVIKNHDRYRRNEEKGETPEAAAGLFPLTFDCPPEVERGTLDFYLRLADDYAGSPMLSALLGVYAARIGDRERSLELFERGYADFVVEPFSITTEYAPKAFPERVVAGPFTANIGGFLTSCLYGLPGLRIADGEPETWCARPVVMPAGWDGLHVDRIWVRGRPATLTARHGDEHAAIVVEPASG
jgi:protein-glucosylgalactosylhydroxylysine glucosidase